jgi:tetratricopeptide (TPR) repeat protein
MRAHNNMSGVLVQDGDYSGVRAHHIRGRELAQKMGMIDWEFSQLGNVAEASLWLGDFTVAENALKTMALMETQIVNRDYYSLMRKILQATLTFFRGRFAEAMEAFEHLLPEINANQFGDEKEKSLVTYAELLMAADEVEKTAALLHESGLSGLTGQMPTMPHGPALQTEIFIHSGDLKSAKKLLPKVEQLALNKENTLYRFRYQQTAARLRTAEKAYDEAVNILVGLTGIARDRSLNWLQALIQMELGKVLKLKASEQDLSEAQERFEDALRTFERMGADGYVLKLKNLLAG